MITRILLRSWKILLFIGFYLAEMVKSNWQVLLDIFTPHDLADPKIIEVPLELEGKIPLFLLSNLITITPGTICIDVSEDGRTLYVEDLYTKDTQALIHHLKQNYERRIIELMR